MTPRPRFLFIRAFGGFQLSVSRFRTSNVSLSPAVPCPDRLLGGKSHRNRAPLWGASRKSDDKLEKQTLRFSPLLCIFRNVHSVSQGHPVVRSFQMEFRIKTYERGERETTKIGKNGRTRERERGAV